MLKMQLKIHEVLESLVTNETTRTKI